MRDESYTVAQEKNAYIHTETLNLINDFKGFADPLNPINRIF